MSVPALYPSLFVSAGLPFMAFEDTDITQMLEEAGRSLIARFGRPEAVLAVSSRWQTPGVFVSDASEPGLTLELPGYESLREALHYPAPGLPELAHAIAGTFGIGTDGSRGLDSALIMPLMHLFPGADIPVVPMSVSTLASPRAAYEWGMALRSLRAEGVLIMGAGAMAFNPELLDAQSEVPLPAIEKFAVRLVEALAVRDDTTLISYAALDGAAFAMPSPAPLQPLLTAAGAAPGERATVFNHRVDLAAFSMSSVLFGFEPL